VNANNRPRRAARRPAAGKPRTTWGTYATWAITVAAAVVGGLAASVVGLRHTSLPVAVAVSLVIGVGTAAVTGRRAAVSGRRPAAVPDADETAPAAPAVRRPAGELRHPHPLPANGGPRPADAPATAQAPVTIDTPVTADVLRVLSGPSAATWWEAARQELPPAASAAHLPPPQLSSYLETAQVAQCPNCGELTLDATRASGGWSLKCPACSHAWTWRPGTPWPDVTVIPRRRPAPGQPPAASKSGNAHGPAGGPRTQWR
jgi:hypothetical protein